MMLQGTTGVGVAAAPWWLVFFSVHWSCGAQGEAVSSRRGRRRRTCVPVRRCACHTYPILPEQTECVPCTSSRSFPTAGRRLVLLLKAVVARG